MFVFEIFFPSGLGRSSRDNHCRKKKILSNPTMRSGRSFYSLSSHSSQFLDSWMMLIISRKTVHLKVLSRYMGIHPNIPLHNVTQEPSCCFSWLQDRMAVPNTLESKNFALQAKILSMTFSSKAGSGASGKSISDTDESPVKGNKRRRKRAISDSDDDSR